MIYRYEQGEPAAIEDGVALEIDALCDGDRHTTLTGFLSDTPDAAWLFTLRSDVTVAEALAADEIPF